MLVLSFRDMSTPRCSAVTTAVMYQLDPVTAGIAWAPPPPRKLAQWADVAALLVGKHVCFSVHGFNVDRDRGYTGLGAFSQEFGKAGALPLLAAPTGPINLFVPGVDLVVPTLWAGDWYLPVNYPFLLPDIRLTGKYLAQLIASSATQMARISFFTHSMGARVVLEAIQQTVVAAKKAGRRIPIFDTAIFTAAAVSDEVLDDPNYAEAVNAIRRIVVVSSLADTVLSNDFPLGNAVEKFLWPQDSGADSALGRYGPRLKTGSAALGKTEWYDIPATVGQDHGDYLPAPWTPEPPYPNGWSKKRASIGALAQSAFVNQEPTFPPRRNINPY